MTYSTRSANFHRLSKSSGTRTGNTIHVVLVGPRFCAYRYRTRTKAKSKGMLTRILDTECRTDDRNLSLARYDFGNSEWDRLAFRERMATVSDSGPQHSVLTTPLKPPRNILRASCWYMKQQPSNTAFPR